MSLAVERGAFRRQCLTVMVDEISFPIDEGLLSARFAYCVYSKCIYGRRD